MSPAGLKGVAEEVGLQMVDRLRPQHGRHLPPQRASTSACTSCRAPRRSPTRRTATSSRSIRTRAGSTNVTQGKTYEPVPLSPKEDEIRRSGGIFAVGRREFRRVGRDRAARSTGPTPSRARAHDDDRADHLGAPRRQGSADGRSRARRCASTPTCCRRRTAPRRSRSTPSTRSPAATRSIRARRRSPTITSSSPAATTTTSRRRSAASSRGCTGSRSRTTRRRATASSISTSPSRGW